jgi:hypothetical protein
LQTRLCGVNRLTQTIVPDADANAKLLIRYCLLHHPQSRPRPDQPSHDRLKLQDGANPAAADSSNIKPMS